jgi:Zn-finger protein
MASEENNKITTIKVKQKTKERIDKLRVHRKDSYDEILQRLLGILNVCRADPDQAQERLEKMESLRKRNKVKE